MQAEVIKYEAPVEGVGGDSGGREADSCAGPNHEGTAGSEP